MTLTRVQFAKGLLSQLHQPQTPQAVNNLVAWMQAEGGDAEYNPLNTTLDLGVKGETNYNKVGVQNYPNETTGEYAEAYVLQHNYPQIIGALNSSPAAFDSTVVTSHWGTKDLAPDVMPINKTVATSPGGIVTPVKGGDVGVSNPVNKKVVLWEPWTWGNAASDIQNLGYRVLAGGIGLGLVLWGLKMLLDSKSSSITNIVQSPLKTAAKDAERTGEDAAEAAVLE